MQRLCALFHLVHWQRNYMKEPKRHQQTSRKFGTNSRLVVPNNYKSNYYMRVNLEACLSRFSPGPPLMCHFHNNVQPYYNHPTSRSFVLMFRYEGRARAVINSLLVARVLATFVPFCSIWVCHSTPIYFLCNCF